MSAVREKLALTLPPAAEPAVRIVRRLRDAGHEALLAGGCVRDLLLGRQPKDYDVVTDARPERVCELFRRTRRVGAQFGVVLVRSRGVWIEVATFRSDGEYADGRHPSSVRFGDARADALRRDFTINGMFLDPLAGEVIDYVGGREDLRRRLVRAIGDPTRRFAEDHLRMLRAVRFAVVLGFDIEPATLAAIRAHAGRLRRIAAERIREELERMFSHPARARALDLLRETGLLLVLWPDARWNAGQIDAARQRLAALPAGASFCAAFAMLLADRGLAEVERICRSLAMSNEQTARIRWLIEHQHDLDDPDAIRLSSLKRLLAHPAFADLCDVARARYARRPDGRERLSRLEARIAAIPPERIAPPPLVTGDDLLARGVRPGPIYKRVLDALYTRQLDEELTTREQALTALDELLAREQQTG